MTRAAPVVILLVGLQLAACQQSQTFEPTPRRHDFASSLTIASPISPLAASLQAPRERVELGKSLFHDVRLSRNGRIACSSCHKISEGGDDGLRVAIGIDARRGGLNTPTVLNSSLNFAQFWDGRAASLEAQVPQPIHNPVEMDSSLVEAKARLAIDADLVARFEDAYAEGLTELTIVNAIASYERALTTPNAPFDRYLLGEQHAISEAAQNGFALFQQLGCVSCHQGRNIGGNMFQQFGVMGDYFAERGDITEADYGRFNVTGREADKFKFKVPSLRNVARTAPYFHDGSAATLDDAVRIMARFQLGRPIDARQTVELVAFLESLTGEIDPTLL